MLNIELAIIKEKITDSFVSKTVFAKKYINNKNNTDKNGVLYLETNSKGNPDMITTDAIKVWETG